MTDYLTMVEALAMQEKLIALYGGTQGVRDMGALGSALFRPQTGYYDDVIAEAAALLESLAVNYSFIDGNKRIAFAVADVFLRLNGFVFEGDPVEAYDFMIGLFDAGTFRFELLEPWLRVNVKAL
ncbi:MAG: type II toxin-antitoxin system death-on-curing family toxin [Pseudomonadota bacterium]